MITRARGTAVASLRLKHINLVDGFVYQDGREVDIKAKKTIMIYFFPMHSDYLAYFTEWLTYLRDERFVSAEDALDSCSLIIAMICSSVNRAFICPSFCWAASTQIWRSFRGASQYL